MIVDDSSNYHARLTIMHYHIDYHQLSCSLGKFKFDMIVDDGFCRLYERMIVSSFARNGIKK